VTIDFFNSEKILRLTPIIKETKEIADEILEGNVRVFPKLANVKVQRLSELWEVKFETSPSTFALYVYALYPLSYLLNAYELTEGKRYLDKAVSLTLDFLDWEEGDKKQINKKRSKILFGDHAVSNRTQALCYLVCCLKNENSELPEELVTALIRNGEYLADARNYSHYNHGLMMDLALLGLLNTLEGLEIKHPPHLKESLMARLQHSITRDLTEDGVHIENSPGYHFWMLGFLGRITPALQSVDKQLYVKVQEVLKRATEYADYITRPDGSVPAIGDTHACVKYKPSKGLESKFFRNSNEVIFRSLGDEVWAHFSSGYKTHVHKHCDNGSFNLFFDGYDVFTDPGFINYEDEGDSKEIKKAFSHNTVSPVGKEQKIEVVDIHKVDQLYSSNLSPSRIVGYSSSCSVESAVARICDYGDLFIERQVSWFKPNVFLIEDKISDQKFQFEQFFQISPGLSIELEKESVKLYAGNGRLIATIVSSSKNHLEIEKALFSKGFNEKGETKRLKIKSSEQKLKTLIVLHGKDESGGDEHFTAEYISQFDSSSFYNEIVEVDCAYKYKNA